MQGVKISWIGRSFDVVAALHSPGHRKYGRRKTKEERRTAIESFVQKYKTLNEGKFPSLSLTHKEVGGSFYTVRQIMREIIEEHKLFDTSGMYLDAKREQHTARHAIEPLSIPAEVSVLISSASGGSVESNNVLELEEEKYQEVLPCTEVQKNVIHNDVMATSGSNDQTMVENEIQVSGKLSGTTVASHRVSMQPPQVMAEGLSCEKEEHNKYKSKTLDENLMNENIHEPAIMNYTSETKNGASESVMGSCSSSLENWSDCEFSEVQEQEFHLTHVKEKCPSITLTEHTSVSDIPSLHRLGVNFVKKQNLLGTLDELGVDVPAFLDNDTTSVTRKTTMSSSLPAENLSYFRSHEADEKHFLLTMPAAVYSTPDSHSHSAVCAIDLSMDLPHTANYGEKIELSYSRNGMLEEPTMSADSMRSLCRTNIQTDTGETGEIRDNILKGQQLSGLKMDQQHMLTVVEAFYRVFLHQLALSALVIQTLVNAVDAHQTVSSEVQSESLDYLSASNHGGDSSDKTPSISFSSVPDQVQGERVGNERRSTLNSCYDGNHADISENTNSEIISTEGFEGSQKPESNKIWDNLKAIATGIFSFWKDFLQKVAE